MNYKLITLLAALLLPLATLAQSGSLFIDELEWADANVAAPGSFAARPDMYTEHYQWGRNTPGHSSPSIEAPSWLGSPCPAGWRVPSQHDFLVLNSLGSTWAEANAKGNAVAGRFMGYNHATCALPSSMSGC
ncbi:MAG: hypothetical protein LBU92_06620, partial [Prevotellaceae bacterium]|nr:hypothetical protein [Prevotellaceae bacterium]